MINLAIFCVYALVTAAFGIGWTVSKSDFVGSIFGNLVAGAITLICINLLLDRAVSNQRAPAVDVANRDASRVLIEGRKLVFDLYGATARSGIVSAEQHKSFNGLLDRRMIPLLAATPIRAIGVNEPDAPAINYMFQDAVAIQQLTNLTMMAHGQYLDPQLYPALYDLSNSKLVSFVISGVSIKALPERFEAPIFSDYFDRLDRLQDALDKADPKTSHAGPFGIMALLEQPGVIPTKSGSATAATHAQ